MLMCSCLVFLVADETPCAHVKERVDLSRYLRQMGPVLRADRRYRWFLTVMALWLVGSTGGAYFTVYAMERFGADAGTVMGYTLAMSAGAGLAGLIGGRAANRVGFVRVFLVGIALTAASMGVAGLTPVPSMMYLAFALTGAGGSASWMAIINLSLELAAPADVPTYYSVASVVRGPAGALAPIAAGLYLGHFPHPPLYLFCAAVCVVSGALLRRHVREPASGLAETAPPRGAGASLKVAGPPGFDGRCSRFSRGAPADAGARCCPGPVGHRPAVTATRAWGTAA